MSQDDGWTSTPWDPWSEPPDYHAGTRNFSLPQITWSRRSFWILRAEGEDYATLHWAPGIYTLCVLRGPATGQTLTFAAPKRRAPRGVSQRSRRSIRRALIQKLWDIQLQDISDANPG